MTWRPRYGFGIAAGLVGSALAAAAAPLATYVLTLATFGLVHVLVELKYVDRRFGPRLPRGLTAGWLLVLALLVGLRIARVTLGLEPTLASGLELGLVALLAAAVWPVIRHAGTARALAVPLVAGALLYGAFTAPVETLVVLAVLHNATPIGFLLERLRGRDRVRAVALCLIAFVTVPYAIATGHVSAWLASVGLDFSAWAPLGTGTVGDHLGVFVPSFVGGAWQPVHVFAAAVYLQCLHYAVVIHILPRLEPVAVREEDLHVRWPTQARWRVVLGVAAVGSLGLFALAFRDARTLYGVIALVHAWVEVPVLLAALAPLPEAA